MSKVRQVTFGEFEHLLLVGQRIHEEKDEPIPAMGEENKAKIASCLAQPFLTFDGKDLYSGFYGKAAILFYLITKGHALQNGNKRMAILTLAYFYAINGKAMNVPDKQLYRLAISTAESTDMDDALRVIRRTFLKRGQ